ncbi:hypothetical protein VT84_19330 [Gemmata sp. SH-PL17]|uniref:DUF58 domain-containing protein n=1 Tax=Gemmata sp. SH-PL17 TaxID=1630693 RepID=UPI0004B96431|nr:DUF58 domain-containing protein [Gemmata sp. SH-PL17]AMV26561.1 hypothetical protein VT84_19330 [Gemmata sp. SH-PL17]
MSASAFLQEGATAAQRFALTTPRHGPANRTGSALGARAGSSLEFRDYRGYEPGDDLRHVDWSAFARSDQLSVKLFREEVAPHLDLLIDGSKSMALAGSAKLQGTLALAGFFAAAAANAGYSHSGWQLGAEAAPLGDYRHRPAEWDAIRFEHRDSPVRALADVAARWRPRSARVLLSDLLWNADPGQAARMLADRASTAIVVQVLAHADANPPVSGHLRLLDSETDEVREVRIDATAAARYRENLARLQGHWHDACRAVGAIFVTVVAEDILRDWRLDPLIAAGVLEVG